MNSAEDRIEALREQLYQVLEDNARLGEQLLCVSQQLLAVTGELATFREEFRELREMFAATGRLVASSATAPTAPARPRPAPPRSSPGPRPGRCACGKPMAAWMSSLGCCSECWKGSPRVRA